MQILTLALALASADPGPPPGVAWSMTTHAVICEMAWQRLDYSARAFVQAVRRADPRARPGSLFSSSCAWADSVRNTTHRETYEYHFINGQRGAPTIEWQRDCGAYDCVATAVIRYARYLADPPRSRSDSLRRAEALKFLGHFVGDLHQPLHAGYRDDLGGNLHQVRWRNSTRNLHAVWDGMLPERARATTLDDARRMAAETTDADAARWATMNVFGWVGESWQLTTRQVYAFGANEDLAAAYADRMAPIVTIQMKKAAVRLAHLIQLASRAAIAFPPMP
jgi:hypothetical protein